MGKGLGSQFVNSWIRQMGRESAHTAYGNMTGKNRMEDIRQIKEEKTFPAAKDYFKLILAQFLPIIGPWWSFIKSLVRLCGKKMNFYAIADKDIYSLDRRYSNGRRYLGTQEVKIKMERLKSESDPVAVKKFQASGIIYLIVSIIGFGFQGWVLESMEENKAAKQEELTSYTTWRTVSTTDDFTGKTTSFDIVLPIKDTVVVKNIAIIKSSGKTYLMGEYYSDLSTNEYDKLPIDVKIGDNAKSYTLTKIDDVEFSLKTEAGNSYSWAHAFAVPTGILPGKGNVKIRINEKIYSFCLDK